MYPDFTPVQLCTRDPRRDKTVISYKILHFWTVTIHNLQKVHKILLGVNLKCLTVLDSVKFSHLFPGLIWLLTWSWVNRISSAQRANQASAPADRGAILRARLRCQSGAASRQHTCCYPRMSVPVTGCAAPREGTLLGGWESEQMCDTVCQQLMPPGMWYSSDYHHRSPSDLKRGVLSHRRFLGV